MNNNYDDIDILLAEDNISDAELAIRALGEVKLSSRLLHVKDGVEALDFLFATGAFAGRNIERTPKLIMLDLKMPRVDGIEVLRRVRSNQHTRHIPVVIMTSSQAEQDVVKSYELGVSSFVVKPIEFSKFAKAVSELGLYWVLVNEPMTYKDSTK